jgi:hypothetical protein
MAADIKGVFPKAVLSLRRRVEQWRRRRPKRRAMPEELWLEAVELARQFGVHPISRDLTVSYTALKKKVADQALVAGKCSPAPVFMELQSVSRARMIGATAYLTSRSHYQNVIIKMKSLSKGLENVLSPATSS